MAATRPGWLVRAFTTTSIGASPRGSTTGPVGTPVRSTLATATSPWVVLAALMTHGQVPGGAATRNSVSVAVWLEAMDTAWLAPRSQSTEPRLARLPHTDKVTRGDRHPTRVTTTRSPGWSVVRSTMTAWARAV